MRSPAPTPTSFVCGLVAASNSHFPPRPAQEQRNHLFAEVHLPLAHTSALRHLHRLPRAAA